MSDIIVGIDLGTTNSAVAIVQDGKPRLLDKNGQKIIPSVVAYSQQGQWLVGRPALNQYVLDPDNTIRSIKRKMGTDETVEIGGQTLTPQEVSAFILRELKAIAEENLGQPVNKAVITVPAYFTNAQRQATQEAGKIAGLEVVRIINEPTAAALAYGLNESDDQMALVYDLGGGTFDVSLVEMMDGVVEVRASHGDTQLGGDDFDQLISDHAQKLFESQSNVSLNGNRKALARLRHTAEMAKIHLSDFPEASLREEYLAEVDGTPHHLDATLERSEFVSLSKTLLARTTESLDRVLEDGEVDVDDIDRVLLVGGSTRMPMVWNLVSDYAGTDPYREINPDEVVALGAAVQAAIIAGQPVDSILVDVTPYSLGIETATYVNGQVVPDIYTVLIQRNSTIPITKEEIFYTLYPGQDVVEIKVYQGEAPIASANTLLDNFSIKNLTPPSPSELASVNVRFDFDVNGMLKVRATDRNSEAREEITIEATHSNMTLSEIAQAKEALSSLTFYDEFEDEDGDEIIEGSVVLDDKPTIDSETQALLDRAQALLDGGKLEAAQVEQLQGLQKRIKEADTQDTLDEASEELLEALFDLE